jgi:large subunit ribosomal protein L28
MARKCELCGKRTEVGNQIERRGITKKKGGIGLRITSRTRRKFKPNIQKVRVRSADGKTVGRKKVCTRCIKAGKILKR